MRPDITGLSEEMVELADDASVSRPPSRHEQRAGGPHTPEGITRIGRGVVIEGSSLMSALARSPIVEPPTTGVSRTALYSFMSTRGLSPLGGFTPTEEGGGGWGKTC